MTEVAQLSLDSSSNPLETEVKTLRKQVLSPFVGLTNLLPKDSFARVWMEKEQSSIGTKDWDLGAPKSWAQRKRREPKEDE